MSINEWTPEIIELYTLAIKASRKQKAEQKKKHEQWLDDFLDGKLDDGRVNDDGLKI